MLSIGQFSKICMVTVKTLRYYDKIGLLCPHHVDALSNYRYYDESQISQMLLIQRYKRYDFSLNEIKHLIFKDDKRALKQDLILQREKLMHQIEQISQNLEELNAHLQDFERTGDIMHYQNNYKIELKNVESIPILSSRQHMSTEEFGTYYGKLFQKSLQEKIQVKGQCLAIYHDENFNPQGSDVETGIILENKEKATKILPERLCATTVHYGAYSNLANAYGAVSKWIHANGYEIADSPYEIYTKSHFDHLPVEEWETDIYFPIVKKEE